ncbi:MAG: histidine kinase, partial [Bacteroidia bacterium]|nr:histidine kinase [Bacteroidia bacterium]
SNEHLIILKDSMMRIEVNKSINDLETKYQSEIKDAKIINLDKQEKIKNLQIRSLLISLIAIALVLSLIIFLYRQKVLKNKQQLIETELRLNRARMDPHFFFNALTSIQGIALKEQGKETSSMLSKFSRMMRKSLESTYNEWITLEDEISFLQEYIDLQKLRNKNPFDVKFEIDDKIEYYDQMIPSMILQPFVENAIEHGFKAMTTNGLIQIKFKNENNNLHIDIIDNGSFSIDQSKTKEFPSRATQITKDRMFLIESKMNQKTDIKITQDNLLGGYHIQLTLPIQIKNLESLTNR